MFHVGRFGVVPAAWLDRGDLGVNEIAVLACLSTYADKNGWCYPSQSTIARQIQRSRPTVNGIIKKLVDLGLVEQHRQFSENGGERNSLYRIRYDKALAEKPDNVPSPPVSEMTAPVGSSTPPVEASTCPVGASTPPVGQTTESIPLNQYPPGEAPLAKRNLQPEGRPSAVPKQPVPDGWEPSASDVTWARQRYPDVDPVAETEKFTLMAQAQGWTYADIGAGWRIWLINQFDKRTKENSNAAPRRRNENRGGPAARRAGPGKPEDAGDRSERNREILGKTRERFLSRGTH